MELLDYVPMLASGITPVIRMLITLYKNRVDVVTNAGLYGAEIYPKMMASGELFFLVNSPKYVGRTLMPIGIEHHKKALLDKGGQGTWRSLS
jgi:hypothetical protein